MNCVDPLSAGAENAGSSDVANSMKAEKNDKTMPHHAGLEDIDNRPANAPTGAGFLPAGPDDATAAAGAACLFSEGFGAQGGKSPAG